MSGTNPTDQEAEPVNKVFECEPEQDMWHVNVRRYYICFLRFSWYIPKRVNMRREIILLLNRTIKNKILELCLSAQHAQKANSDFLQPRCRTKDQGVRRWTRWWCGVLENDSQRAVHDKTYSLTLTLTLTVKRLQAKDRRAWNASVAYGQSPLLENCQVTNISIGTRLPEKKLWSNM